MAMCAMLLLAVAPCQCSSPGGIQTVSQAFMTFGRSFLSPTRPTPLTTCNVYPNGCVCHAVRAPGSNATFNARTLAGSGALTIGSCHTVPVNQSDDACLVGRDPAFMIFIDVPLEVLAMSRCQIRPWCLEIYKV